MARILLYQWCSDTSEAIIRALPQAMSDHVIDVTDFGYFRLNYRRLASVSGECEAKLRTMLEQQVALLDQHEHVVCYGTPAFFIAWLEAATRIRFPETLKADAHALLGRFDRIYLPNMTENDTELGKRRTMEVGLPLAEELLRDSGVELLRISDFITYLGSLGHGI